MDIPMPPSQSGSMQDVRAPQGLTAAAVEAAWTGANSLAEPLLGAEDRRTGSKGEERPDAPQARSSTFWHGTWQAWLQTCHALLRCFAASAGRFSSYSVAY